MIVQVRNHWSLVGLGLRYANSLCSARWRLRNCHAPPPLRDNLLPFSFYFFPAQTARIGRPELFRLVFGRLCAWVLSIPHEIHCCMHCLLLGFIVEPGYNFPSGILRVSCEGELVFFRYRDICPVTV